MKTGTFFAAGVGAHLLVQIPAYNAGSGSDWPTVRAAQAQVAGAMASVEMVVTKDLTGYEDEIHPPNKQPVGERLAYRALQTVYGKE